MNRIEIMSRQPEEALLEIQFPLFIVMMFFAAVYKTIQQDLLGLIAVVGVTTFVCGLAVAYKYYCEYVKPKDTTCCKHTKNFRKPKVLFFPDQNLPCNSFYNQLMSSTSYRRCLRSDCQFLHEFGGPKSSLIQVFLALNTAKRQIDICMYILTNRKLAEFLIHSKRTKGIKVRLITDCGKSGIEQNDQNPRTGDQAPTLAAAGIEVRTNAHGCGALMHNKFVIIDNEKLIIGSFNWTNNAVMRNDEALIIMPDKDITVEFASKFEKLWRITKAPAYYE